MASRAEGASAAIERLVGVAREAAAAEPSFAAQVSAAVPALLDALAADPDLAETAMAREESEGRERWPYREALASFAPLLERAAAEAGMGIEEPGPAARAVIAGLTAVILREVDEGRGEDLAALAPELVDLALSPFAGSKTAAEAMRRHGRG